MQQKFEKGSEMFSLFGDYYKICQKFWIPEQDDKYWSDLQEMIDIFYHKYNQSPFAKGIALALLEDIERRYNNEQSRVEKN